VYCVNTTLAEHAYYTVLCSTITTLSYHHTSSTSTGAAISSAKSSAFPFHCFTSLSSGPSTTFQMAFHGFHGKDQSNKKRDLLPLFTLHEFMFSEKKMKKLMKSIEDSFEYTLRLDEFEQIHNTPKNLKYADSIVAEIEKKERLLSKSQGNPNSWSSWMKTPFVQSHSSTFQCRILLLILPKLLIMKKKSVILINLMNKFMR